MEHLEHPGQDEQFVGTNRTEAELKPAAHITHFEGPDGDYEETSFLHEPIESYKDDLFQLDMVLRAKRDALAELEQKAALHSSAAIAVFDALNVDFTKKLQLLRESIGRLEIVRTVTQQRLMMLVKHDHLEQRAIGDASMDIEH